MVDIVRPVADEADLGDILGVGERETGLQLSQEENRHIFLNVSQTERRS